MEGEQLDQMASILDGTDTDEPIKEVEEIEEETTEEGLPDGRDSESSEDTEEEKTEAVDEDVTWGKALGIDDSLLHLDEEGNLAGVKVKIDGVEDTVKVQDLIAGYQTNKYNTQKSQALAEEQKVFEQNRDLIAKEYAGKLETVQKLTEHLHKSFLKDYEGIDWARLRAENPAEYAATIQDYQLREAELQRLYAGIETEKTEVQQKTEATLIAQQQEQLKAQIEKTLNNNPEWRDPEKLKAAVTDMQQFVNQHYGFSEVEFQQVQDARLIELIKDAMAYRKGKTVAEKKLAKPLPIFQKTLTKKQKAPSKLELLTKKAKNATGSAKRTAETNAIAQLLDDVGGL